MKEIICEGILKDGVMKLSLEACQILHEYKFALEIKMGREIRVVKEE